MNAAYIPVVLWITSSIIQGIIFAWAVAKKRGHEEAQIEKIAEQRVMILALEKDIGNVKAAHTILETQVANIRGWLRGSFGGDLNGGN